MNKRGLLQAVAICLTLVILTALPFTNAQSKEKEKGRKYYEERGEVVWDVKTEQKVIALTFDDGPNPAYTPQILDLLKQYNARCTFFLVGQRVKKFPQIARRIVAEGHEAGNHTFSHPYLHRSGAERIKDEIAKGGETIYAATGQKPKLFRSPGGYYNDKIVHESKSAGYKMIMWSWHQDTRDWSDPGVKKIVGKVLRNARKGDIVLFHDHGGDRRQTINALKEILPELQKRGFQFVTVSELLTLEKQVHVSE